MVGMKDTRMRSPEIEAARPPSRAKNGSKRKKRWSPTYGGDGEEGGTSHPLKKRTDRPWALVHGSRISGSSRGDGIQIDTENEDQTYHPVVLEGEPHFMRGVVAGTGESLGNERRGLGGEVGAERRSGSSGGGPEEGGHDG